MSPCPFPFTQEAVLALPRPRSSVRVFKQASPFPVSCQIIALGIQGSSASRRTKLKLELVELLRRNIVFPGDVRAAHGQAPTAAVSGRASTPPWSRCDPQGTRPCWAAPGHKSLGSLQVGAVQGPRVGQGQRGLFCPQPLCPWGAFCAPARAQPWLAAQAGSFRQRTAAPLRGSAQILEAAATAASGGCVRSFLQSTPRGMGMCGAVGGPHSNPTGTGVPGLGELRHLGAREPARTRHPPASALPAAQMLRPPRGGRMGLSGMSPSW